MTPAKYRYPGLQPFSTADRLIFFGREGEIEHLVKMINIEKMLVLYGKSGLGKSSLIAAGIIPRLTEEGNYSPLRIRLGSHQVDDLMELTLKFLQAPQHQTTILDKLNADPHSLWYQLKLRQLTADFSETIFLFIDQFEEVFTYPPVQIKRFKRQLADLLHNVIPKSVRTSIENLLAQDPHALSDADLRLIYQPLEVKVLLAIRSDKMSLLDQLKDVMPEVLSKTYELDSLNRIQAEDAIVNPAYQRGGTFVSPRFDYHDEALDKMLDFLTKCDEQKVEPFQLQVLCQYCENIVLRDDKKRITIEDLGDVSAIFENFYESLISQLEDEEDRAKARQFIEEGLILEEENLRLSLHEGQILRDFDISKELLEKLVNTRLIRTEPSPRGGMMYEISHDTLIKPIITSKRKRLEQEKLQMQATLRKAEIEMREAAFKKRLGRLIFTLIAVGATALFSVGLAAWYYQKKMVAESEVQVVKEEVKIAESTAWVDTLRKQRIVIDSLFRLLKAMQSQSTTNKNKKPSRPNAKQKQDEMNGVVNQVLENIEKTDLSSRKTKLIEDIFSANTSVRRNSLNELATLWKDDPQLVKDLINYANKHISQDTGVWNSLYLLERMDPKALNSNQRIVDQFVSSVEKRFSGATARKRVFTIRDKSQSADSRNQMQKQAPLKQDR